MNQAIVVCTGLILAVLLSTSNAAVVVGVDPGPDSINLEGVTTDLFDVAQGTVVTGSSALYPSIDARNAFGYFNPASIEPSRTIFSDNPIPTDFIDFHTSQPISLGSFKLFLGADTSVPGENRWAKAVRLYASSNSGDVQSHLVSAATISGAYVANYGFPAVMVSDSLNLSNVQFFRLEVDRGTFTGSNGPRVIEFDGFAPVPEPASLAIWSLLIITAIVAYCRRRTA